MKEAFHPTDQQWDQAARERYRRAYPEMVKVFRDILGRSFLRNHWIPDPLALDYLTKVLIRFVPFHAGEQQIEDALALLEDEHNVDDPREMIRYYETVGELILWWSSMAKRSIFQDEGRRSYQIAYEHLSEFETPTQRVIFMPGQEDKFHSKRLKVNKMFSEHFVDYQEVLERTDLIEDPAYVKFRDLFMTDDFSIN